MAKVFLLLLYFTSIFSEYQLGVVMIFRDEGPYLKEWIEYHKLVGVDHFWLFNNLSKDNYQEILQPYVDDGLVDLYEVPIDAPHIHQWNAVQTRSYNRALNYARGHCKWLAAIDADEYIVPVTVDTIPEALAPYEGHPGVALHWLIFGTSLVEKIPSDKLMLECLTRRGDGDLEENRYVKLIIQPKDAIAFNGPHMCAFKTQSAVSTTFYPVKNKIDYLITHEVLRINHYWSRDLDYLQNVKIPRSKVSGGSWAEHMERELNQFNVIEDDLIFRFLPKLRENMQGIASLK